MRKRSETGTAREPIHDGSQVDGMAGVVATGWGYILASGGPLRRRALVLAEGGVALAGVALLVLAVGQWLAPLVREGGGSGPAGDPGTLGYRLTATAVFAMGGLLLMRYAAQGFRTEAHFDRLRGEIRIVARNCRGRVRLLDCIAFADITAVSVDRMGDAAGPAHLMLHPGTGATPLALLRGPARHLSPLAAMVARDILRVREMVEAPHGSLGRLVPGSV